MKLLNKGVGEGLLSSGPLAGVELEEGLSQVKGIVTGHWELLMEWLGLVERLWQRLQH